MSRLNWLKYFPARKCFGVLMGTLAGVFAVLFLGRSLFSWADVPDGALGMIGVLTGGFGGYMFSSSYEAAHVPQVVQDEQDGQNMQEESQEGEGKRMGKIARSLLWMLAGAAVVGLILFAVSFYRAADVREETKRTDTAIRSMDQAIRDFGDDVRTHENETQSKVVIIREQVRQEISALDPDGLAAAALDEIELFRGSAGSGADSYPAGLDGDR